jgi:hypothetical protein
MGINNVYLAVKFFANKEQRGLKETVLSVTNNVVSIPSDLYRLKLIARNFANDSRPIDIVDSSSLRYILNSADVTPTSANPIAVKRSAGYRLFPDNSISSVILSYYKIPSTPIFGFQSVGSDDYYIYDSSISTDFELPESTHNDITIKILKYLGINLRDSDLSNYALQTEVSQFNKTR